MTSLFGEKQLPVQSLLPTRLCIYTKPVGQGPRGDRSLCVEHSAKIRPGPTVSLCKAYQKLWLKPFRWHKVLQLQCFENSFAEAHAAHCVHKVEIFASDQGVSGTSQGLTPKRGLTPSR